jgi:hypothetical protein
MLTRPMRPVCQIALLGRPALLVTLQARHLATRNSWAGDNHGSRRRWLWRRIVIFTSSGGALSEPLCSVPAEGRHASPELQVELAEWAKCLLGGH